MTQKIKVIIPAYNEEDSIAKVINDIPTIVDEIIVISNNSTDKTEENAANAGATVLKESKRGYGYACLKGMDYIASTSLSDQEKKTTIVVFLDGDYSDYPEQLTELVAPIINGNIDLVIGSRVKELREAGSMTPQQVFGNWLATFLMNIFFGAKFTDLGPFRAIKYQKLLQLKMEDKTYGWTVEMQLKAIKQHFSYKEVPMKYRNRIGISKVSGTLKGSILAGVKILGWILKYSFK
ncbi:glycosyltransferase family 2 protein [Flavobacteriaceae bacterium]|nr:glycosyltransferase family 2 protein [Flavobacteriaceae bacterium]MDB4024995.1 glycosyltransferase family 2 protein [Flavobacteriaceae bacterium]